MVGKVAGHVSYLSSERKPASISLPPCKGYKHCHWDVMMYEDNKKAENKNSIYFTYSHYIPILYEFMRNLQHP